MHRLTLIKIGFFSVIGLSGVFLLLPVLDLSKQKTDTGRYSIPRQVRYSFTLKNTFGKLIQNADLWAYGPVKQTPAQKCISIKASHPYKLIEDESGNQILHFVLEKLPPYANRTISIEADLMMADSPNPTGPENLQPFINPSKFIECDDAKVIELAETLKSTSPEKTTENIYHWVSNHITYTGFSGKDRGALYALKNKKGDCTEYTYLYAALCRANAIPVRCVGGYICTQNEILSPAGYHNWAEIFDNSTWQPVDPQRQMFRKNASWFVAMRIFGNDTTNPMGEYHRFRFKGDGLKVKMAGTQRWKKSNPLKNEKKSPICS